MKCEAGKACLLATPQRASQWVSKGSVGSRNRYPFSATFWHLKNAEQHVGRFLAHPNVLLKGF